MAELEEFQFVEPISTHHVIFLTANTDEYSTSTHDLPYSKSRKVECTIQQSTDDETDRKEPTKPQYLLNLLPSLTLTVLHQLFEEYSRLSLFPLE